MRQTSHTCLLTVCLALLIALCVHGVVAQADASEGADIAGSVGAPPPVSLRTLYSNVYLQTSAEYRACCLGIYAAAAYRLEELLEDLEPEPACPAVVMDLDMTVLDVSSFQTYLYVNGLEYTPELWVEYERDGMESVRLVPGAKRFIERAEALGVTVVYLSNRNEVTREFTVAALERLGVDVEGIEERIYLKPTGASSDKSPRRDALAARHNVLVCLGDNLRDFSEIFKPARLLEDATAEDYRRAIEDRAAAADDAACHWGVDWFVLPNPIYGEWEKLVSPTAEEILQPSFMETTGEAE